MGQEIKQANSSEANTNTQTQKTGPQSVEIYRPKRWVPVVFVLGLLTVGAAGAWFILWASRAFTDPTAALTFIMGSIISLFLLLSTVATTCIYWGQRNIMLKQWGEMHENVTRTDLIIEKMQGQLDAMRTQEGHLLAQAEAAKEAADMAKGQLVAMQHQEQAQFATLEETRKIVAQNEQTVEAMHGQVAEMGQQTKLAIKTAEATVIAERAYLGILEVKLTGLPANEHPKGYITLRNGGKTPAWNVEMQYAMSLGPKPIGFRWQPDLEDPSRLGFFVAGAAKPIDIIGLAIKPTESDLLQIQNGQSFIFLYGEIHYNDYAGSGQILRFRGEYHPPSNCFNEHYQQNQDANPN